MERPDFRAVFLDPRVVYPLAEVAHLTGIALLDLHEAIARGGYEATGETMTWAQLVTLLLTEWSLPTIHEALGPDVAILPPLLRPEVLSVQLPRYQVLALQVLAEETKCSVSAYLSDRLLDLGDINALDERIPGYRAAVSYPLDDDA